MFTKKLPNLKEILAKESERLILWIPVLIGLAAYLSISYFSTIGFYKIIFCVIIFSCALCGYLYNRNSYRSFIFSACAIFLFGFLSSFFYQKFVNNYTKITGKIFVDVKASVSDINKFTNKMNGREGFNLLLSKPVFYKSEFKGNKKNHRQKNIDEEYILKNFMNVGGYQEIDREFLDKSKNYQEVNWIEKDGRKLYYKPPRKISVVMHNVPQNLKIGDEIYFRASITPPKKREFVGDFDFALDALAKRVGGYGMASGEIIILQKTEASSFADFVTNLRKKIQAKILTALPSEQGNVAAALLMGNQNLIGKPAMTDIRNSGLAHLISISGLHLSLAAGIFFFTMRFLLSRSEYLTLRFDIKKIAAASAIVSSYFYLEISGAPVPAVRSFIAVLLVMLAIIFDRKIDPLRSICFAALVLILFNPYNIFSISFQLSFAAMLSLIAFHEIWIKSGFKRPQPSFRQKLFLYFIEMILISSFVQLAATPFLIYYFGDVALYGALSNMVAIPLTSFTTMPLGFASFFLMPFGLEKLVLIPMGFTITWVLDIAHFVSNLTNSHFYLPQMPKFGLVLAIFGGLIFCLSSAKLKPFGALIFLCSFLSLIFIKSPDLLIDGDGKFFALYDKKNGLVFSKELRHSKKRDLWMKKMNEAEFKSFQRFSDESLYEAGIICNEENCELRRKNKTIFVILTRGEINKICEKNFDVIINLTRKYKLPNCAYKNNILVENFDLLKKGVHFFYFDDGAIKIKTAN